MRSARLRHTVILQESKKNQNSAGEQVISYNDLRRIRANVVVISGVELIKAGADMGVEVISVLMRYTSDVKHDLFLSYNDNTFHVISIKPDDRKRRMTVTASREING